MKPSKNKKVKAVTRATATYRFPPSLLMRIKYAHELETKGKLVQVSENTFVIHVLDKVLPKLPK